MGAPPDEEGQVIIAQALCFRCGRVRGRPSPAVPSSSTCASPHACTLTPAAAARHPKGEELAAGQEVSAPAEWGGRPCAPCSRLLLLLLALLLLALLLLALLLSLLLLLLLFLLLLLALLLNLLLLLQLLERGVLRALWLLRAVVPAADAHARLVGCKHLLQSRKERGTGLVKSGVRVLLHAHHLLKDISWL